MATSFASNRCGSRRGRAGLITSAISLASLACTATARNSDPIFTRLGTLPGRTSSTATGVSADGSAVCGWSEGQGYSPRAFRWTRSGGVQDLGSLPGRSKSKAFAISGDGSVVVGGEADTEYGDRAWRWTAESAMQLIGSPSDYADAQGVSADGSVIVGFFIRFGEGAYRSFRWTISDGNQPWSELGTLPGAIETESTAVSDDGSVVVGLVRGVNCCVRAFKWTAPTGMMDIGILPDGTSSEAYGVSADAAVVVGSASASSGTEAFRWTGVGGMQPIGLGPGESCAGASAIGVSADGSVVVGQSLCFNPKRGQYESEPFVWTEATGMRSVRTILGASLPSTVTLNVVAGISADATTIVGTGEENGYPMAWAAIIARPPVDCPGDATGDATVDFVDVISALVNWGTEYSLDTAHGAGDADGNGTVDFGDVLSALSHWGAACP